MRAASDWAFIAILAAFLGCGAWLIRWACQSAWARFEAWRDRQWPLPYDVEELPKQRARR